MANVEGADAQVGQAEKIELSALWIQRLNAIRQPSQVRSWFRAPDVIGSPHDVLPQNRHQFALRDVLIPRDER